MKWWNLHTRQSLYHKWKKLFIFLGAGGGGGGLDVCVWEIHVSFSIETLRRGKKSYCSLSQTWHLHRTQWLLSKHLSLCNAGSLGTMHQLRLAFPMTTILQHAKHPTPHIPLLLCRMVKLFFLPLPGRAAISSCLKSINLYKNFRPLLEQTLWMTWKWAHFVRWFFFFFCQIIFL